ncbi:hypothetical protein QBC35DRAFT_512621 [Podospora australis]|uniref:Translation initiation factor eIF2B subunit beta n=1 Tax=Podospora australis TaxID=1536484 RepID=A0AAN7AMG4_9PEZI|nr:hypothetical protein QBC35DRAFT_512621 [Podospora australis]
MAPVHAAYAPSLDKWIKSLRSQSLEASIESLIYLLKRRQVKGDECATATAHTLLQVVARSKWHDVDQLLNRVQSAGSRLARAAPNEPVIGNIVRRVLGLIREEATEDRNIDDDVGSESASDIQALTPVNAPNQQGNRPAPTPVQTLQRAPTGLAGLQVSKSMFNLFSAAGNSDTPLTGASTPLSQAQPASVHALRSEVIEGIQELMDELSQADDQIASFSDIQIHPDDYVLAYQPSKTVERFLIKAASRRRFTVLIANSEPIQPGATETPYAVLRKKLNSHGVTTINLATNALMAYIPRVNKVIFGAKAVYQNGGVLVDSGAYIAAEAAQEFLKPVIVLGAVYKLCPEDPSDETVISELGNPSRFVSYANGPEIDALEIENTVSDYLPPSLVDVYITNLGPQSRPHLASILADHYKVEDIGYSLHESEV